jgi:hypothetical protein
MQHIINKKYIHIANDLWGGGGGKDAQVKMIVQFIKNADIWRDKLFSIVISKGH